MNMQSGRKSSTTLQGDHVPFLAAKEAVLDVPFVHTPVAEESSRYRCLFEANTEAVFLLDRDGRFVEANAAAERLCGYSEQELRSLHFAELCTLQDRHKAMFFFARAMSGITRSLELSIVCHDGSCIDLQVSGALVVSGGNVTGVFCTARDITRHRRSEAHLRRACRDAEQARDRFLSILSHELRTPLMPVLTMVQMLEREPEITGEMHDVLGMMRRNLELEARLIDDLLDLNRIRQGKLTLQLEDVDIHKKLKHVLSLCTPEITRKRLTVNVDTSASEQFVVADPARLNQVLWTIIGNAAKFTPEGGSIGIITCNGQSHRACVVGCGGGKPLCKQCKPAMGSQMLAIHVTDNGAGISPAAMRHLFDGFERADAPAHDGSGGRRISLSISKALVELHGGQLAAHSNGPGKGTTFTVLLPLRRSAQRTADTRRKPPGVQPAVAGRKVLLVEDHADTARALSRLLLAGGFTVQVADCVSSAIAAADKGHFDLLVSDIGLPDGTGLDVVRHLRTTQPIPAIALSGYGMEDDIRRSREAGFAEHLVKPINIRQLQEIISALLPA